MSIRQQACRFRFTTTDYGSTDGCSGAAILYSLPYLRQSCVGRPGSFEFESDLESDLACASCSLRGGSSAPSMPSEVSRIDVSRMPGR